MSAANVCKYFIYAIQPKDRPGYTQFGTIKCEEFAEFRDWAEQLCRDMPDHANCWRQIPTLWHTNVTQMLVVTPTQYISVHEVNARAWSSIYSTSLGV